MSDELEQRILRLERQIAAEAAAHRERRERIATAALAGLLTHYGETSQYDNAADCSAAAVAYADALIAGLDKEVKP